jgi:N6-L-threonylcarbamoyladenine synthase
MSAGAFRVLGIESSCDETAAAVVEDGWRIRSNVVSSSIEQHQLFGGVVPELASRAHIEAISHVVDEALARAECTLHDIDLIAVTAGPGLVGALLVGVSFAQGLAMRYVKPLLGVNHLAAHLYGGIITACEEQQTLVAPYPAIGLVVSGGHTVLVRMATTLKYAHLGETQDDAAGEAFDKVAKLLQLGYPGGPRIESVARDGDPAGVRLPRPRVAQPYDFSFSGLKTAVYYHVRDLTLTPQQTADVAASFQQVVIDVLIERTERACRDTGIQRVIVGGGVTANRVLRSRLEALAEHASLELWMPGRGLSIDNAAMIAGLGGAQWMAGHRTPHVRADPNYAWCAVETGDVVHAN